MLDSAPTALRERALGTRARSLRVRLQTSHSRRLVSPTLCPKGLSPRHFRTPQASLATKRPVRLRRNLPTSSFAASSSLHQRPRLRPFNRRPSVALRGSRYLSPPTHQPSSGPIA